MKAAHLAQTLSSMTADASAAERDAAVSRFVAYLKARRLTKLLPAILREYEKLAAMKRSRGPRLVVAHKGGAKAVREAIRAAEDAHEVVDHGIIGGYILETEREYVDASHRGALLRLYRSLFK